MTAERQATHYVGDDCPGGHQDEGGTPMTDSNTMTAPITECAWDDCHRLAMHDPTGGNCCGHEHPDTEECSQPFCCYLWPGADGHCGMLPEWRIYLPAGYPPEVVTDSCSAHLAHLLGGPVEYPVPSEYIVVPIRAGDINESWWREAQEETPDD